MTNTFSRGLALDLAALIAATPAAAKDRKPVDPNKKVCRSEVPTGSRMAKSTCHTVSEWAEIDSANAAAAGTSLDRAALTGAATGASAGR